MDRKINFQNIQILRLTACLMVFLVHFGQRMYLENRLIGKLFSFGAYGVQLFFVISGFLIAHSCEQYARQHTGRYIGKRLGKILPLYYALIGYYFITHTFVWGGIPADPKGFGWLRYIFFLNGILPGTGTYFWDNLGITWTIPYFVWAYVLLPPVYKLVRSYWGVAACFVGAMYLADYSYILNGYCAIAGGLVYFFAGGVVYWGMKEDRKLLTMLGLWAVIVFRMYFGCPVAVTYGLLFAQLILITSEVSLSSGLLNKILQISDRYSFAVYLGHGVVFCHILDRYLAPHSEAEWIPVLMLRAAVAILGTAAAAVFLNRFIEQPAQKWLNKKMKREGSRAESRG